MSEVTRFIIRNFQSHQASVIEPAPAGGLTVIVGATDAGKSAVIRAFRWVLDNQPQGDGFRRIGSDFVEGELNTTAGDTVIRRRTATTNRYIVNGTTLEGFGNSVPAEVQEVTGVRRVRLGDQEILANLASQLDPPFLGSSMSGPNRAKVLGKLAGTEAIDMANRELGTDMYRWRQDEKRLADDVESLQDQVTEYDYLPQLAEQIGLLKSLAAEINAARTRLATLQTIKGQLDNLSDRIAKGRHYITTLGNLDTAHTAVSDAEQWNQRRNILVTWTERLGVIASRQTQQHTVIRSLGDLDRAAMAVSEAGASVRRLGELISLSSRLTSTTEQIGQTQLVLDGTRNIDQAHQIAYAIGNDVTKLAALHRIKTTLGSLTEARDNAATTLAHADKAVAIGPVLVDVGALKDELLGLRSARNTLESLRQKREAALGAKELAEQTVADAQERYTTLLAESGTCPLCGSGVEHDHIMEVLTA